MAAIDLDALKRLAEECKKVDGDGWYTRLSFFGIAPEADRKFIADVSPNIILALIARLERAENGNGDR
jgi:hypothetical protein